MIVCFDGFVIDQMIIVVSKDPLATIFELGDHATQLTLQTQNTHYYQIKIYFQTRFESIINDTNLALWKPHSCL